MEAQKIQIITEDDYELSAYLFEPQENIKGTAIMVPAMGVAQFYYHHFAKWLSVNGFAVITFDYRGTGLSKKGKLRNLDIDIMGWARLDCEAAVKFVTQKYPNQKLTWIGHSLGGQLIPFVPSHEKIQKIITIACGSGYWLQNSPPLRWRVWWLWYFVVPVVTPILGYFPGKSLKKVGDLPKGVILQWRKWCLNPQYAVGVEGDVIKEKYAQVKTPLVSFSFADDEYMSAKNTQSIHSFYTGSEKKMIRIKPLDINEKRIGHFGFFKSKFEKTLWQTHLLPEIT